MQSINSNNNNQIILKDRSNLEVKGVKKVNSLNTKEFNLNTNLGPLIIKGENLEMVNLDLDRGEIVIVGKIYLMHYNDVNQKTLEKNQSFFKKMFK